MVSTPLFISGYYGLNTQGTRLYNSLASGMVDTMVCHCYCY